MSSNNPFSKNVNRTNPFVPSGMYNVRIISMKCWTHDSSGSEHPLPTMGLITQIVGENRQIKMTLSCPENEESYDRFATKVMAVLDACGIEADDFYVPAILDEDGNQVEPARAGDALAFVSGGQNHERCPVGKVISISVTPDYTLCRHKEDGAVISRELYQELVGNRPLMPNELWRKGKLCRYTGYYSLQRVH